MVIDPDRSTGTPRPTVSDWVADPRHAFHCPASGRRRFPDSAGGPTGARRRGLVADHRQVRRHLRLRLALVHRSRHGRGGTGPSGHTGYEFAVFAIDRPHAGLGADVVIEMGHRPPIITAVQCAQPGRWSRSAAYPPKPGPASGRRGPAEGPDLSPWSAACMNLSRALGNQHRTPPQPGRADTDPGDRRARDASGRTATGRLGVHLSHRPYLIWGRSADPGLRSSGGQLARVAYADITGRWPAWRRTPPGGRCAFGSGDCASSWRLQVRLDLRCSGRSRHVGRPILLCRQTDCGVHGCFPAD
jgi:hypothetical protein